MLTKNTNKSIGNSKFNEQLANYKIFGVATDVDYENIESINLELIEYNKQNQDDQIELIDQRLYKNYGFDFSTTYDAEKFRQYIKDYSEHSFMNLSGKPVIVKPFYEKGLLKYEFASVTDFKNFNKQDKFNVLNGKRVETVYFADEWLENGEMRNRYKTTVFDPSNKHDADTFNFWKGFIKPIKGDVKPFLGHINKLIKGTKDEKDYIIKLLAYSVRYPDRLTGTSLAFRGDQGAGKSTISETMKAICPNHSKIFDNMDTLFDFNAETTHTKYFLMEESVWGGEISKQGKLKNLITCPDRAIKIKNLTGFDIVNYGFFIFTSNESWMLPVEKGDRRFNIFDCSKDLIDDFDYFSKYYDWLNKDGKHALCNYFMNEIDLTDFNPKKIIANSAKTDVKSIGLPAIEKFILGALSDDICVDSLNNVNIEQNGDEKYELDTWEINQVKVNRHQLHLEFSEHTKREKIDLTMFSRKLAEIFNFPERWKDNWKSGKNYYYKLPSKVECMEMFAKYIKEKPESLFPNYTDMKSKK